MKTKRIIYRPWYDYEKEEKWLNGLANEGWAMTDMFLMRYVFEKTEPGKFIYCIQLLEKHATHPKSLDYIRFLEDTGITYVAKWVRWIYLRKPASEGPFELHSDRASKISHLQIIYRFWIFMVWLEGLIGGFNLSIGLIEIETNSVSGINSFLGVLLLVLSFWFWKLAQPIKKKIVVLEKEQSIME